MPIPSCPSASRFAELLVRMNASGYSTLRSQAIRLGLPCGALRTYALGGAIPEDVARDIEWMMELPAGWLDGEDRGGVPEHATGVDLPQSSHPIA